jgi:hypothetical protein
LWNRGLTLGDSLWGNHFGVLSFVGIALRDLLKGIFFVDPLWGTRVIDSLWGTRSG